MPERKKSQSKEYGCLNFSLREGNLEEADFDINCEKVPFLTENFPEHGGRRWIRSHLFVLNIVWRPKLRWLDGVLIYNNK